MASMATPTLEPENQVVVTDTMWPGKPITALSRKSLPTSILQFKKKKVGGGRNKSLYRIEGESLCCHENKRPLGQEVSCGKEAGLF